MQDEQTIQSITRYAPERNDIESTFVRETVVEDGRIGLEFKSHSDHVFETLLMVASGREIVHFSVAESNTWQCRVYAIVDGDLIEEAQASS